MKLDRNIDIGYIFKGSNCIPIRPMIVNKNLVRDNNYKVKNNTKLFIHDEIIKYYIATKTINISDNLYDYDRIYLYEALTSRGFTIIIRANHQLLIFLGNRIGKQDYLNINEIISTLNEPVKLANLTLDSDNIIKYEEFDNMKVAVNTLNTRYKKESGNIKK